MTISSEITRINDNIASAYTACNSKGATMPVTQNSANLATCINSISGGGGITPTGTLSITQSGIYDVTNYASANVNVSGGSSFDLATIPYVLREGGVLIAAFYYDSNSDRFYLASCDANGYIDSSDIYFEIDILLTGFVNSIIDVIGDSYFTDYLGYYDNGYQLFPILSLDGTTILIYNYNTSELVYTLQADPNVTLHY